MSKSKELRARERQFQQMRRASRFPGGNQPVTVRIAGERGIVQVLEAEMLDLSARGVRLATRAYVHANVSCEVRLRSMAGEDVLVFGDVRWCDYVSEAGHRVGVEFEEIVDPRLFIKEALITATVEAEMPSDEAHGGRILVALHPMRRPDVVQALEPLGHTFEVAGTPRDAFETFSNVSFDLLITDRNVGVSGKSATLVEVLREHGFRAPILLLGERDDLELATIGNDLDVAEVVRSPWTQERIAGAVELAFSKFPDRGGESAIYSTVEAVYGTPKPVRVFILRASEFAALAMAAQKAGNHDALESAMRQLEAEAAAAGFPQLVRRVSAALKRLTGDGGDIKLAFDDVRRISDFTARLACRTTERDAA
ncbi:MAG: PilZ domain-containing protein [Planctomycetota bacterium]